MVQVFLQVLRLLGRTHTLVTIPVCHLLGIGSMPRPAPVPLYSITSVKPGSRSQTASTCDISCETVQQLQAKHQQVPPIKLRIAYTAELTGTLCTGRRPQNCCTVGGSWQQMSARLCSTLRPKYWQISCQSRTRLHRPGRSADHSKYPAADRLHRSLTGFAMASCCQLFCAHIAASSATACTGCLQPV